MTPFNSQNEIEQCDAEIARCAEHICEPGEFLDVLQGWADWQIERQLILAEREHGGNDARVR